MKEEGSLVEKDVTWEIGTTDAEGEFTKVATSYDGQAKFVVPAGAYQVRCIRGEATLRPQMSQFNPDKPLAKRSP